MRYETLKKVIDNKWLVEEDWIFEAVIDWSKESIKDLQEHYGDLNKFLEYLAEDTPEEC